MNFLLQLAALLVSINLIGGVELIQSQHRSIRARRQSSGEDCLKKVYINIDEGGGRNFDKYPPQDCNGGKDGQDATSASKETSEDGDDSGDDGDPSDYSWSDGNGAGSEPKGPEPNGSELNGPEPNESEPKGPESSEEGEQCSKVAPSSVPTRKEIITWMKSTMDTFDVTIADLQALNSSENIDPEKARKFKTLYGDRDFPDKNNGPGEITSFSEDELEEVPSRGRFIIINGIINLIVKTIIKHGVKAGKTSLEIGLALEKAIEAKESRRGFLSSMVNKVYFSTDEKCNVIIFQLKYRHMVKLEGVIHHTMVEFDGQQWGIWVAKGGTFYNYQKAKPTDAPHMAAAGDYKMAADTTVVHFNNRDSCFLEN